MSLFEQLHDTHNFTDNASVICKSKHSQVLVYMPYIARYMYMNAYFNTITCICSFYLLLECS